MICDTSAHNLVIHFVRFLTVEMVSCVLETSRARKKNEGMIINFVFIYGGMHRIDKLQWRSHAYAAVCTIFCRQK